MPVIELDMLIAFVNKRDKLHKTSKEIFNKIVSRELKNIKVASSAYLEYELILKSRGYSLEDVYNDLRAFKHIKNLGEIPLSIDIILKAMEIRDKYEVSYFDSLHVATALEYDKTIISTDHIYNEIKEIKSLDPKDIH